MLLCFSVGNLVFPKNIIQNNTKNFHAVVLYVVLQGSSLFSERPTSLFIYLFFGELNIERFSLAGYFTRGEAGEPGGSSRLVS